VKKLKMPQEIDPDELERKLAELRKEKSSASGQHYVAPPPRVAPFPVARRSNPLAEEIRRRKEEQIEKDPRLESEKLSGDLTRLLEKKNVNFIYQLGNIFEEKHDFGRALNEYRRVLGIDPAHTDAKARIDDIVRNTLNAKNRIRSLQRFGKVLLTYATASIFAIACLGKALWDKCKEEPAEPAPVVETVARSEYDNMHRELTSQIDRLRYERDNLSSELSGIREESSSQNSEIERLRAFEQQVERFEQYFQGRMTSYREGFNKLEQSLNQQTEQPIQQEPSPGAAESEIPSEQQINERLRQQIQDVYSRRENRSEFLYALGTATFDFGVYYEEQGNLRYARLSYTGAEDCFRLIDVLIDVSDKNHPAAETLDNIRQGLERIGQEHDVELDIKRDYLSGISRFSLRLRPDPFNLDSFYTTRNHFESVLRHYDDFLPARMCLSIIQYIISDTIQQGGE
jgi:tetratricopeptide (TPR) repeat protein